VKKILERGGLIASVKTEERFGESQERSLQRLKFFREAENRLFERLGDFPVKQRKPKAVEPIIDRL
jgi:hypothetical protein